MNKEEIRVSLNKFLKMYFDACREVYSEINFDRITKIQFKYLKAIKKHEPTTLTQLSDLFSISKPTMNEVITKFEKSGLITKEKNQDDKRITYISLTEIGTLLATTNTLESQRAVEKMMDTLSQEEVQKLTELFNKFGVSEE
jgi:DNA-binding MarR family transcriptional regulator